MANCRERAQDYARGVPRGRVVTYGQVAECVGGNAQHVGTAMRKAEASGLNVPWQRVVRADGSISRHAPAGQRERLEAEGLSFDDRGRVDLQKYQWTG